MAYFIPGFQNRQCQSGIEYNRGDDHLSVLLENEQSGLQAITLANWAYRVGSIRQSSAGRRTSVVTHVPAENVLLIVHGAGAVSRVESCMLEQTLEFSITGEMLVIRLPRLEEGDILLLSNE